MAIRSTALLLLLAFAAVVLSGIALRPLIPIDETRYVDVAWEMHLSGAYLVPQKNFEFYTDKPPLLFWLINLVWAATGVSGFAARLVGPAFALAVLAGTWGLGRRLWDARSGAVAAMVLSGTSVFAIYGGATMFDTMLALATVAGIVALWQAGTKAGANRGAWAAFGLALAFGVYAKGPVILLHLLPALLAWPIWTDPQTRPARGDVLRGAALAIGVALAAVALWVVPAAIAGGAEYRRMILWEQSSGRVVQSFAHARPWWWLIATLPVMLFPWVWTPIFWSGLRRLTVADRALRLCLIWAGGGLALFSLVSGKQVHYLVPELPAAALIVARIFLEQDRARLGKGGIAAAGIAASLGIAALGVSTGLFGGSDLARLLSPVPPVAAIAAGLLIIAVVALRLRPVTGLAVIGLAFVTAINLTIGLTGLGAAYDSATIASRIAPVEERGIAVVMPRYNEEFDFEGRLLRPVATPAPAEAKAWLSAHPGGVLLSPCRHAPLPENTAERVLFNGEDWCLFWG